MDTVSRSAAVHFSTRKDNEDDQCYSLCEQSQREARREDGRQNSGWRIFSRRRSVRSHNLMSTSHSYRRERARKRNIFLQTYKLQGAISSRGKLMGSRNLKKIAVKVKTAVVAVLAFMRGGALRPCSQRSAIRVTTPVRIARLC